MILNEQELMKIGIQKRNKQTDVTWAQIAYKYGFPTGKQASDYVRKRLYKYDNDGNILTTKTTVNTASDDAIDHLDFIKDDDIDDYDPQNFNYKNTTSINNTGNIEDDALIKLSKDDLKNPSAILKAHGFDPCLYELINARNTMWHVQSKNSDEPKLLYSSKITVKPIIDSISIDELKAHFESFDRKFSNQVNTYQAFTPVRYQQNGKMLEINITDLHLGKFACTSETGGIYNTSMAKEAFFYIINDVLSKTKHLKFEKILFVYSNDFFHYDTINVTTTAGTSQDTDIKWADLFKLGCDMLVEGIEMLSKIAPVSTFYIGSNHDKMTSFYSICYLSAWFKDNPNVTIDTDPISRKIETFGNNLICFMHGDMPKKQIFGLLPKEHPIEWGNTKFREIHAGHFHSEQQTIEDSGVIVRYLSSPTGTDYWHFESGYTGAIPKAQHFVWDKKYGLEQIIHTPLVADYLSINDMF